MDEVTSKVYSGPGNCQTRAVVLSVSSPPIVVFRESDAAIQETDSCKYGPNSKSHSLTNEHGPSDSPGLVIY